MCMKPKHGAFLRQGILLIRISMDHGYFVAKTC
jgi:hypothetical protein